MQAGITLVQFVFGLYLVIVMLRFLLQIVRADFYNPISQAIVQLTNPPLRLLRKFIPGFAGIDWPSIVLLLIVQSLEIILLTLLTMGSFPQPIGLLLVSIANLLQLAIYVYIVMIIIMVVISWINPGAYNPITMLIHQLTDPLMQRIRRVVPPTAGIDWSAMVILLILYLALPLLVAPIMDVGSRLLGLPFRLH